MKRFVTVMLSLSPEIPENRLLTARTFHKPIRIEFEVIGSHRTPFAWIQFTCRIRHPTPLALENGSTLLIFATWSRFSATRGRHSSFSALDWSRLSRSFGYETGASTPMHGFSSALVASRSPSIRPRARAAKSSSSTSLKNGKSNPRSISCKARK